MTRLIPPPPIAVPGVVPGGPVYSIPAALLAWLTGKGPFPWPAPKPAPPVVPPTPVPLPAPHADSADVVAALNTARKLYGKAALVNDLKLSSVAQYWSQHQADINTLTHGPGNSFALRIWSVYPGTQVGEIVAEGARTIPEVVTEWMDSPAHKDKILGNFTAAGAGMATTGDGVTYWCCDFKK